MYLKDDPIIPIAKVPKYHFHNNENVIYAEFKTGGHIGQFSGLWPRRWYHKPMIEFINAINMNDC